MDAELYGSKGALALLSDEANSAPVQRRGTGEPGPGPAVDADGPSGPVTVGGGGQADMGEYAHRENEHLVLKPTALHSGAGVIQGWLTGPMSGGVRSARRWIGLFVLQRRIRAAR